MTTNQFNAALGFAFVIVAVALNFGWAILALVAAGAFYMIGSLLRGESPQIDLQQRARAFANPPRSSTTPAGAMPAPRAPRVT
ncbi:MAG: hypothetical protein ACTHQQ_09030 [Solirubrobacteraceae bacterium]